MKSIDGNEPAFPLYCGPGDSANNSGMTLRDYFAAKLINECLKHCATKESAAIEAYSIADAMLAAREAA